MNLECAHVLRRQRVGRAAEESAEPRYRMNLAWIAQILETGCQQAGQTISPLNLAQERQPGIGTHIRTVKAKQDRLAIHG